MNSDGRETAIELVERIKRAADKLQDKGNSIHETLLEICKLARQLNKKLICISEKIGRETV